MTGVLRKQNIQSSRFTKKRYLAFNEDLTGEDQKNRAQNRIVVFDAGGFEAAAF
jgi:hypothetical protein